MLLNPPLDKIIGMEPDRRNKSLHESQTFDFKRFTFYLIPVHLPTPWK